LTEGSGRRQHRRDLGATRAVRILRDRRWRRLGGVVLSLVVIGIAYALILPTFARYGAVWRRLSSLSGTWVAVLAASTVLNVVTFAFPWMVVIPRLSFIAALRMTQASTALTLVVPGGAPMGMAISFGMLRSRNISSRVAGFAVALTGIWNQLSVFLFPVVALMLVAADSRLPATLEWVALAGVVVTLAIFGLTGYSLASPERARRFGDRLAAIVSRIAGLLRREPVGWNGETLLALREEALGLLRQRWLALSVTTLANQLTGYLMLELSLRAVGISLSELTIAETFAAWSIGRLLGSLPITPGGVGIVELGLIGTLVGFGGRDAQVVAGVLLYRFLVVAPTLVLGALAGLTWRLRR
jgi:uncharacterized membrane protein YbhN (UPF0104 family)